MMNFVKDFTLSTQKFLKAFTYLFKNNLGGYIFAPIIIGVFVFYGFWSARIFAIEYLISFFEKLFNLEEVVDGSFWAYIKMGFSGFVYVVVWLASFYLYFTISKYLVLIFLSPVLALLSEKVEEIETGQKYTFNLNIFINDVLRGVCISLRNLFFELLIILVVFLITFFLPVLSPLSPFVTLYFSAYFVGFSFVDYSLERRRFTVKESSQFMRKYSGMVVANGLWFNFLFYVPIINVIIAPLVAVIAASLSAEHLLLPFSEQNTKFRRR